jgi:NAD(P)H-flavin reductase
MISQNPNPYEPVLCEVEKVVDETPTIKTFVLKLEKPFSFRAGQFIQLTLPGVGEAPFTPSSSPLETAHLGITIIRTGSVTDRLHEMIKPGSLLGVRGPFGKGYPFEKYKGHEILVVGGGCGLAPLRSLIHMLLHNADHYRRVSIKYGARSPEELVYRQSYDEWRRSAPNVDVEVTIDTPAKSWTGNVGLVTTLLNSLDVDIGKSVVFSCGPEIMLKFVTYTLLDLGFKPDQIYLSMNRRMSCGIGKCGRCNIGPYYLCKNGPDINYALIQHYDDVF